MNDKYEWYARFTDRARLVFQYANQEALRLNSEELLSEHVLLGLVREGTGVAHHVLIGVGLTLIELRRRIEPEDDEDRVIIGRLPQNPLVKRVVEAAIEDAQRRNHNYVGTEHVLMGLIAVKEGKAFELLEPHIQAITDDVNVLLGGGMKYADALRQVAQVLIEYIADNDGEAAIEKLRAIVQ